MNKKDLLDSNCKFLEKYSKSLADKFLNQNEAEVTAAIKIQNCYRAYVARKVYSKLLAEQLNTEEEEFFQRELTRASESSIWLKRSKLRRKMVEKKAIDGNLARRREQSAICIQRHWRRWKISRQIVSLDLDPTFLSLLEENFPHVREQYFPSMFSGSSSFSRSGAGMSTSANNIVRKIVPNNNNMSLFCSDAESEYTLEVEEKSAEMARSEFETPVPAKRPIVRTSYVFEKELREDFANPYCIDSSDEDDDEDDDDVEDDGEDDDDVEDSGVLLQRSSSQSLESRVSEESLTSTGHVCDSGFEDDGRGSSSSLIRPSHQAWAGDEEYLLKRDIYTRPSAVQMCFVEEVSDDPEEVTDNINSLTLRDSRDSLRESHDHTSPGIGPNKRKQDNLGKRFNQVTQCSSESNIATKKDVELSSARPWSYSGEGGGMLKSGWKASAHLMTLEQLNNWLHVMQSNCANVNTALVEHLAERDELQEHQDTLLQRIFTLKNVPVNGVPPEKPQPQKQTSNMKRRVSSFFGK